MKSAARFLLLFFCLSPEVSQGRVDDVRIGPAVPPGLPDLWDELQGLNELVLSLKAEEVERRLALRSMESRLRDREVEAKQQRRSLDGLEETAVRWREELERTEADRRLLTELNSDLRRKVEQLEEQSRARAADLWTLGSRLNLSESSVEDLKKKNTALAAELPFLQTRLRASESTLEQLRRKNAVLAARLCNSESLMEELRMQISATSPASSAASNSSSKEPELDALNTNTEALQSRLDALEEELNTSAEQLQLRETRLKDAERHLDELKTQNTALNHRMSVGEHRLDELQTQTTAARNRSSLEENLSAVKIQLLQLETNTTEQTAELMNLQRKLNWTESLQNKLNTELLNRLSVGERRLDALKTENAELLSRLNVSEKHLEDVSRENSDQTSKLMNVQRKLNTTEAQLDRMNTELIDTLSVSEKHLEALKAENTVQSVQLSLVASRLTDNTTAALDVRLRSTETRLEQLEVHFAAVDVRLSVTEKQLEHLETENTVQSDGLLSMDSRLTEQHSNATELFGRLSVSEKHLEDLKTESSALELRLNVSEKHLEGLKAENTAREAELAAVTLRLDITYEQVEELRTQNTALSFRLNKTDEHLQLVTNTDSDELKVAFSAGLTDSGSVGPFDEETTLIFSKTITNIGRAYNQSAGVFTAPVRGVYVFSFTAADFLKGYMGLYLYRNNQPIIFNLDLNDHGGYASTSNSVALQLEESDRVRLGLPASYRLYDDSRNFSIFSGFLLFPL